MPTLKITNETPILLVQLKEELKRIKERDQELNFRAAKTAEYLNFFAGLRAEQALELLHKIEALNISRLKPEHMVKIVDLLPGSVEELKNVLSSYTITVSAENIALIVETVKPYLAENVAALAVVVPPPVEPVAAAVTVTGASDAEPAKTGESPAEGE